MASAAVKVYGRLAEVDELADRLLEHLPEASVSRRRGQALVVSPLPPGSPHLVSIEIGTAAFAGTAGDAERRQLAEQLRTGGLEGPGLDAAVEQVPDLRLAVSFVPDRAPAPATLEDIWELAAAIAGWVDGFALAPDGSEGRGPDGRAWAHGPGVAVADHGAQPDDLGAPVPAGRVVARLLALVAVSARSLSERDGHHDPGVRAAILAWCAAVGVDAELEPAEADLLQAPGGEVAERDVVDGSWAVEAAAVLAWSLSLLDLPGPDELVDPGAVISSVGFPDPTRTIEVLGPARLRPRAELDDQRRVLTTVHRRIREHALGPEALDLTGLRLVDGDLAVGDVGIAQADGARLRRLASTVLERHRAANWLAEGGVLSETSTAT